MKKSTTQTSLSVSSTNPATDLDNMMSIPPKHGVL